MRKYHVVSDWRPPDIETFVTIEVMEGKKCFTKIIHVKKIITNFPVYFSPHICDLRNIQ